MSSVINLMGLVQVLQSTAGTILQYKLPTLTAHAGQLGKTLASDFCDKHTAYSAVILYMHYWSQAVYTPVVDTSLALWIVVFCWDQWTSKRKYSQLRNPK